MTARRTDRTPSAADHKPEVTPTEAAPAAVTEPKVRKPKAIQPCKCGCGATTKSTFAPGHDMRVGPRADGKAAGEVAGRNALASGEFATIDLPADKGERALFLAGFANGIKLGLVS